jgi:hypothetical protein
LLVVKSTSLGQITARFQRHSNKGKNRALGGRLSGMQVESWSATLIVKHFYPLRSALLHALPNDNLADDHPIVLIAAMITMTVGVVCHSHTDCSACPCPLCHLVVAPSLADLPSNVLTPLGERLEPQVTPFVACSAQRRIPARAPPA